MLFRSKYKGRAVFQGNNVRDEDNYRALFEDLGSSPASMAAGKLADYVGLQNGCACETADALRAYTQSLLSLVSTTATWVRLPKEIQPSEWRKFRDPVVPLRLALYGHPDAGSCWEKHCNTQLAKLGFQPIPNWPGCFSHPKWSTVLVVYVDDFKMAAPVRGLKSSWAAIAKVVNMGEPAPTGRYLGCDHADFDEIGRAHV